MPAQQNPCEQASRIRAAASLDRRATMKAGLGLALAGPLLADAASAAADPAAAAPVGAPVRHRWQEVGTTKVFYREAGPTDAPVLLLLHGFPSSSHMFRNLIPMLADSYRVIAPDLPGFGYTSAPPRGQFAYTFDALAETVAGLTDALGLTRYSLYMFDYGAPVGFRLALSRPGRVTAIIVQNGNAYAEGLQPAWDPIRTYWEQPTPANREALRAALTLEATRFAYLEGASDPELISPDCWHVDQSFIDRPGAIDIHLDLFGDYRHNVAAYPRWQAWLRERQPPALVVWGRNDPYFGVAGAEGFRKDLPNPEIHLLETGHFALETHCAQIAQLMRGFLGRALSG